ncbi:MAG TPA: OB-fold domain-containing protein [bacterium]|nr:OB-fold domain-containing protein [bacterium]
MIGITGWGCYVPRYRLTGEVLAQAWGGSKAGARAAANHDEDTITMAAEAAMECVAGRDPLEVDRLYFATTTRPYLEHQNAAIVAAVADLRHDILACDFGASVRSSTNALRAAYDAVKSDEANQVMVCASDMRLAEPGDPAERTLGDGAAALMVGRGKPVAVFKGFFSTSRVFLDYWRTQTDRYIQSGDAKFITDEGIMVQVPEMVDEFLASMDLAREEIAAVVYYAPEMKLRKALDKKLGFKASAYPADEPQSQIGNTGSAQVFFSLLAALQKSKPGDKIVMINHSSGADACLMEVTEHIANFKTSLNEQIAAGRPISSYAKYLKFRKVLPQEQLNVWASPPVLWREEKQNVRRLAKKCKACGAVQFPVRYQCWNCGKEEMGTVKLQRRGEVFTFTLDSLVPNPDPPTPMVSVDLEGGGRLYTQMTDTDPKTVKIGMKVEMVFRKLHEGGGFYNYFWKFRPVV